jgi:hypothetical protein
MYQWLDARFVEAMLNEHFAGSADHGQRIWLLLTLEIWLRGLEAAPRAGRGVLPPADVRT